MIASMGSRGHLVARATVACILAAALLASTTSPAAAATYNYAAQRVDSGTNGVDGYVRQPVVILDDPLDHVSSYVGLCSSYSLCSRWVQAGQYQGTIAGGGGVCPGPQCIESQDSPLSFWENKDACNVYRVEENARPEMNYPYYINWTGASVNNPCGGVPKQYKYEVRQGSWTNPPVGTAWMPQSIGVPDAEAEVYFNFVRPNLGIHRYGLDDAGAIDHGYAMRYYTRSTGVWHLWDHVATQSWDDAPMEYDDVEHWSSFRAHD